MANDRLFIVCKKCGEHYCLFKWFVGYGYSPDEKSAPLGNFIHTHLDGCHGFPYDFNNVDDLFRLAGEGDV